MRVVIDGKDRGTVKFSGSEPASQRTVFRSVRLKGKEHNIRLVNEGGTVAVDALVIE